MIVDSTGTSTAVPGPFNWERVLCPEGKRRYLKFVNPQPGKGVIWVARLAKEMHRRRPDIPFMIVEGRARTNALLVSGLDLRGLTNLHGMANTPDPREFYRVSRAMLMPSLAPETFGRVVVEGEWSSYTTTTASGSDTGRRCTWVLPQTWSASEAAATWRSSASQPKRGKMRQYPEPTDRLASKDQGVFCSRTTFAHGLSSGLRGECSATAA